MTKAFRKDETRHQLFRRVVSNYADDDQIDNTSISFPISFQKAIIYGAEGKLDLPEWNKFSGFLSYSYQVGNAWNPVTGGLFLGDDARRGGKSSTPAIFRSRRISATRCAAAYVTRFIARFWFAAGIQYDAGFPLSSTAIPRPSWHSTAQQVLDRINFDRGRIDPALPGECLCGRDQCTNPIASTHGTPGRRRKPHRRPRCARLRRVVFRNAIGPPRSGMIRLTTTF